MLNVVSDAVDKVIKAEHFYLLLPMPLIFGYSLWVLAYYFHVYDTGAAYAINIGLRVLVAIFIITLGLGMLVKERYDRSFILTTLSVPGFFIACFIIVIFLYGFDSVVKKAIGQFVLNAAPAFIVGIYCARYKSEDDLLRGIEKYGLILLPAAVIYVLRFLVFSDEIYVSDLKRLGGIDYMSFAYGLLPLMVASCLLLFKDEVSKTIWLWRWFAVCIYWSAIVFSQTRGAMLGGFLFLSCLAFVRFKNNKKRVLLLSLSCVFIFFICLQIFPKLFGEGNTRFSEENINEALSFTGGAAKGLSGVVGKGSESSNGIRILLENDDNGVFIDKAKNICIIHNRDIARRIVSNDELYHSLKNSGCTIKLSRMALLEVAVLEMKNNPLVGMGPLAFEKRYFGFHPHNLFLQILVELGFVLGGFIVLCLCYLAYVFLLRSRGITSSENIMLFAWAHIPMFAVSGTFWSDAMFFFLLGYALVFYWGSRRKQIVIN